MLIVYKGEAMYYVIVVVSIFFILYYSLIKLSNELDASDYRVSAKKLLIPLVLLGGLIYINTQGFLIDMNVFVTPSIVGLIIAYTYPIIYYLTNQNSKADFLHSYDFVWGIYSVIELILIEEILGTLLGNSIVYHLIYTVVLIVFLLPSILMIAYYALYKKIIDVATVQTVYYTQKFEMIEFFKTFSAFEKVSIGAYISSFFIGLALLSVFSVIANPLKLSEFIISIVLFCGITYFVVKVKDKNSLIKRTGLIKIILDFHRFQKELKQYMKDLCLLEYAPENETEQAVLLTEWENFAKVLLASCTGSKTYCSTLFGIVPIKDASVARKIAEEIDFVTRTYPQKLELADEFAPFREVMVNTYCNMIENGSSYWYEVVNS